MVLCTVMFSEGTDRTLHLGKMLGFGAYSHGIAAQQDHDEQYKAHHLIPGLVQRLADELELGIVSQYVPQLDSCQQNQEAHEVSDS